MYYVAFMSYPPFTSSQVSGVPASAGLMQVRSLTKRHKGIEEEVANHLKAIEDLTDRGTDFDNDDQAHRDAVDGACNELSVAADALKTKLAKRGSELEAAVKVYTIIEEMNEIEVKPFLCLILNIPENWA